MQTIDFDEALEKVVQRDSRYDREAYRFVRDALDFTQQQRARVAERPARASRKPAKTPPPQHVSGPELLAGIRDFALQQFGPMTSTVFAEWGVHETADFGEIVFNMVDAGLLNKEPKDSREDFKDVYGFHETFDLPFLPQSRSRQPTLGTRPKIDFRLGSDTP